MATATPRLVLRKPQGQDVVNVLLDVNANMDKLDSSVNLFPCTAATRPTSPFTGQLILLTDAQTVQVWTGSTWITIGGSGALGKMGLASLTADTALQTSGSGETGPHMSITFTADANRRYWVQSSIALTTDGAGGSRVRGLVRHRRAAGAVVTTAGTQIGSDAVCYGIRGPNGAMWYHLINEIVPGVSGQTTVGIFLLVSGSGSMRFRATGAEYNQRMVVRDVGV